MDRYVMADGKRLRCGLTTGSCAAAASAAAAELLVNGVQLPTVTITLPNGEKEAVPIASYETNGIYASAGVIKDAGDDPDITNGALIISTVRFNSSCEITIDGGVGVGRVTLPGLDQPVGAAAINSTPRRMIRDSVLNVLDGRENGLDVVISIPEGETLAKKTFNSRLGIIGGLSVLGTGGIVEPMSESALVESIQLEIRQRYTLGKRTLLLTPGNYGKDYLQSVSDIPDADIIRCSNFVGDAVDCGVKTGFTRIILISHLGKLVKLAGNMFNTHSKYGDCRMPLIAAHAAKFGISAEGAQAVMASATVDRALEVLDTENLTEQTLLSLLADIEKNLEFRCGFRVPVATFTNTRGMLVKSNDFEEVLKTMMEA